MSATPAVVPEAGWATSRLKNRWARFAVRRLARLLVSLWVLVTAAFFMVHLVPGDPVRGALGPLAPASLVAEQRRALGLDDPLLTQYWHFLRNLLSGDLGTSFSSQLPVSQMIGQRLPATAELAVLAFVVAAVIAVPLGVTMAVITRHGRGRRTELAFAGSTIVLGAIPDFLLGVVLAFVFAVHFAWFPVAGKSGLSSYVLPVMALAVGPAAILSRIVRVEMLAVLDTDYIRTARAKRLPGWRVQLVHALPNAVTATLTISGLLLGSLIAGTVLVENVFAWPGLGSSIVQSILTKDYPLVQGCVLVYGVGVLLINTVVDIALAVLDPRSTIGND
jgi:peptide/nickel transport system permease protein